MTRAKAPKVHAWKVGEKAYVVIAGNRWERLEECVVKDVTTELRSHATIVTVERASGELHPERFSAAGVYLGKSYSWHAPELVPATRENRARFAEMTLRARARDILDRHRDIADVGTVIATTYRLRPVGDTRSGDWCHATIDDEYWTLSITSDHGNWSYRWNTETGRTLTAAIASDFGTDYMACKLCPDRSKYDPDETEKGCKRRIIEARRDGDLTREEAREAWRGLEDVGWDDERQTYDDLGNVPPAWLFRDDTSEYLKQSATGAFLHLRDAYLPALIDALRALPGPTPDPLPGTDKTNG